MEYYWLDPTLWPDPMVGPAEGSTPTPTPTPDTDPDEVELEPGDIHDPYTGEPWKWLYPSL